MNASDILQDQIDGILHQLEQAGVHVLDLLQECWLPRHEALWKADPRLYRGFARKLISGGHPARAIELLREGVGRPELANDLELQYLLALAFARGSNRARADYYLTRLEAVAAMSPDLRVQVLSLRGRLFKDRYRQLALSGRSGPEDRQEMQRLAASSAEMYSRAYDVAGEFFPLINFATMSVMEGKLQRSRELAEKVVALCERLLGDPASANDYWLRATLAVAEVILGRPERTMAALGEAVRLAGSNAGDVNALRRDLHLLKDKLLTRDVWEAILAECKLGNVLVFAGHMIDTPGRPGVRFPDSLPLVRQVQARIHDTLSSRNPTVAFCSAASGADLIFAQQFLSTPDAELHVVFPFRKEDFLRTSVDYGLPEMEPWRKRFESVLAQAKQVHFATTESYLGDNVLFDFVNSMVQGLGVIRAEERGVEAEAVVVRDQHQPTLRGGTADFIEKWQRTGRKCEVIELSALRTAVGIKDRPAPPEAPGEAPPHDGPARIIRAMLFADVKGFSKLAEEHFRRFFATFLQVVRDVLDECAAKPLLYNTWGDGLFVVFEDVVAAAHFSTQLLNAVDAIDWVGQGFPEKLSLRIGLHYGPVYEVVNPLTERRDFFGSHVNRAARIEPVTTPGCAFASEQFAAALAIRSDHDFVCEFIGIENLAKEYDRCPLYSLTTTTRGH
jgi:class 3 adenylate cyclase